MIRLGFQNILLWRHAHAAPLDEPEGLDIARPLSRKGFNQAEKMASWLLYRLPKNTLIISSNAVRAEQTAHALKREYLVFASLAPTSTLDDVLETLDSLPKNNPPYENLLLIGHQPWLGLVAAQLVSLPQPLPKNAKEIGIKKGAVWWFKRPTLQKNQPFKLHAVQTPNLL